MHILVSFGAKIVYCRIIHERTSTCPILFDHYLLHLMMKSLFSIHTKRLRDLRRLGGLKVHRERMKLRKISENDTIPVI